MKKNLMKAALITFLGVGTAVGMKHHINNYERTSGLAEQTIAADQKLINETSMALGGIMAGCSALAAYRRQINGGLDALTQAR